MRVKGYFYLLIFLLAFFLIILFFELKIKKERSLLFEKEKNSIQFERPPFLKGRK